MNPVPSTHPGQQDAHSVWSWARAQPPQACGAPWLPPRAAVWVIWEHVLICWEGPLGDGRGDEAHVARPSASERGWLVQNVW